MASDCETIANPNLPAPPKGKYPAKAHARRVAQWVAQHGGPNEGLIYLEGQTTKMTEDDDQAIHFRQRRHFFYITGCDLPDCLAAYDIKADKITLWIPPVDPDYVLWAGMPLLPHEAMERYDVDVVLTTDEMKSGQSIVEILSKQNANILAIKDRADLEIFHSEALSKLNVQIDLDWARKGIEACRVVKDDYEVAMIRHANIVSSYAHEQVMASARKAANERELNAVFSMHCHANGCKEMAYGCICASGSSASSLHYVNNDLPLEGKLNLLLDAGSEYNTYCSDITRTFPLTKDGKFTNESKAIYTLVLKMQSECFKMIKAGVKWDDVHYRAHEVAAAGLQDLGILRKDLSVLQILESRVTTRFFPHGLGHYLGMDTHDVGGMADHEDPDEMYRYLRIRGRLPAGAVVTNEPGIYFRQFPLRQELESGRWDGFIDQSVLERYWAVGGVRIEDDVLVTEEGYENLTTVSSDLETVQAMVSGMKVINRTV